MDYTQIVKLLNNGKHVTVRATADIYEYLEDSMDPGMISKILSIKEDEDDLIKISFDLNGFETHNKSVARSNWYENGNATKTWFESGYYPKDGIETAWFGKEHPLPFEILTENKAFEDYLKTDLSKTYIQFLEEKYEELSK